MSYGQAAALQAAVYQHLSALPVLAGILTGDFGAYKYLGTSIAGFPDADGLDAELKAAGFAKVSHKRMLFGTVALHQAQA